MSEEGMTIEELKKIRKNDQEQSQSNVNYSEWDSILNDFETAGIPSTGTYAGDVKLHRQIMSQIEQLVEEDQVQKTQQQLQPQNKDENKIDKQTSQDKEQVVKANVVNATSSTIMANYMRYYHLLG